MKIYTKRGDKGETTLYSGHKVSKSDIIIEALGSVDECNSSIGAALSFIPNDSRYVPTIEQLIIIQHALFDIGAALATPRTQSEDAKIEKTRFDKEEIALLELWIDEMNEVLPRLTAFILPGGSPSGAMMHVARSICRRAERLIVPLHTRGDVSDDVMMYMNRLSDYLFMTSRHLNHLSMTPETKWKAHLVKPE